MNTNVFAINKQSLFTLMMLGTHRVFSFLFAGLAIFAVMGQQSMPAAERRPMRKASELISRPEQPIVSPRVLERVTSDTSRVLVSLSKQRAYLMVDEEIAIDTPISSGKKAGMTPTGSFTVTEKDKDHRSNLYGDFVDSRGRVVRAGISLKIDSAPSGTRYVGAPMKFFMRLTDGGIGMHVGILPGYPASHGCIRLPSNIAPLFYERVKIGTPVEIVQ